MHRPALPIVLEPEQRPLSSVNMPFLFAALKLAAAAVAIVGSIIYSGSGDGPTPPRPPPHRPPPPPPRRDSYYSDTPTQESPKPPPPYTPRPPATNAHSHTAHRTSSALSDELAGVEDARKLREEARRSGREMKEAYDRAKSAQQRGLRGAAQEHRQRGDAHKSSMEGLDKRAANILFRENNKNRQRGEIDLHDLFVAEAVRFTKEELRSAMTRGDQFLRFIVGKGKRSQGEAKLRPALEELFTGLGLSHFLDTNNGGVLIVQLF